MAIPKVINILRKGTGKGSCEYNTKAYWDTQIDYVPTIGTIIVYSDLNKMKIADGISSINDLSWWNDVGKQNVITAQGILEGDGFGNISGEPSVEATLIDIMSKKEIESAINTASATLNNNIASNKASIQTQLNRSNKVNEADTNYSTPMVRGIYAGTADLTSGSSSLTSGVIYAVYE